MNELGYTAIIPLLPLASFLILAFLGKRIPAKIAGLIGTLSLATALGFSLQIAIKYFFTIGAVDGVYHSIEAVKYVWLPFSNGMSIDVGVLLDPIAVMMLVVITLVSTMVHLYSLNYMHGDERFQMYYAYLSLFTFSMLGLVIAVNIFQMYIFWELVGVSSFLLIGFYFTKDSAIAAAKKAFIVTRFADLGFLIGILILSYGSKTFDFGTMITRLTDAQSSYTQSLIGTEFMGASLLTWGLLLVFMGGAGKSAMFPLHIWLPDAMEGPTPVSALIHAATMVVAGVFLVARLFPVFAISCPVALDVVAYIGIVTALFAAIIACSQTDIKRVLAYSTISQIAFMMFALGSAGWGEESEGYTASMFHLFTHAFFKAALFLGAGAVIHAVHSNEMKDMGGLRKMLPITHLVFLVACLAIAGVPPFAGFFSKEAILGAVYHSKPVIFYLALFTSGLTAFYMFRLYFSIFWNDSEKAHHDAHHSHDDHAHHGSHESHTWLMNIALLVLGTLSVVTGFISFGHFVSADGAAFELPFHLTFSIAPVLFGLSGIGIAALLYKKRSDKSDKVVATIKSVYTWSYNKFYIDAIYLFITKKIIFNLIGRPAAWIDRNVVDGMMNGAAFGTSTASESIKGLQSGKVQQYALVFFGGTILLVVLLFVKFL